MDVKKVFLPFVVALLATLSALAQSTPHYVYIPQYHYVPTATSEPWNGHSVLALHVGTGILPKPSFDVEPTVYTPHAPFSLSLRYAGEKNISDRFFWGWHSNLSFFRLKYDYTLDGNASPITSLNGVSSLGCNLENQIFAWSLAVDESFSIGYAFNRRLDISVAAGVSANLLSGGHQTTSYVNRTTYALLDEEESRNNSLLGFLGIAFLMRSEVRYFFSDNFFLSLEGQFRLSSKEYMAEAPCPFSRYGVMLGVGYKAFRKKNPLDD